MKKTVLFLGSAILSLFLSQPAAACAPEYLCLSGSCWYELLNDPNFAGTTCSPQWVFPNGSSVINSTACSAVATPVAVLAPAYGTDGFRQDFTIPNEPGSLEVTLWVDTIGNAGSLDKVVLELRNPTSGLLLWRKYVTTSANTCGQRFDYTVSSLPGGGTMQLRVKGAISTSGVKFHVTGVQVFYIPET
ncbi:MAG TPA: hypothetical protein VMW27_03990 [Thermoanaerobaculia bacterium]|nr:hypothetical protein [Thermoanaerobaculia bacterium]